MSELLEARQQEAVVRATDFHPTEYAIKVAGQSAVAAQYGPTDSGKGHHGSKAVAEVNRRIALGQLPEHLRAMGINRSIQVRPFTTRSMRPEVEIGVPPGELPYVWYCDLEDDEDWEKLQSVLDGNAGNVIPLHDTVYGTLLESYQPDRPGALCVVEFTGDVCKQMKEDGYFGSFSATLLFAKRFDRWIWHVIDRDGPEPKNFGGRLVEGSRALKIAQTDLAQDTPELGIRLGANDYGEEGDIPAYEQLADGYLGVEGHEQVDRHAANLGYLATFTSLFNEFKEEYEANPRPLTEIFPAYA